MKKRFLLFCIFLFVFSGMCFGQSDEDKLVYNKLQDALRNTSEKDINNVIIKTAKFFLDTPYSVKMQDQDEEEKLLINLRQFDCVIFLENVLALSFDYCSGKPSFDNFVSILEKIRYRDGKMTDYFSRLHYTLDWIENNQKKGFIKDITGKFSKTAFDKHIDFMSTHTDFYPRLKNNPENIEKIKLYEDKINQIKNIRYIRKEDLPKVEKNIPSGSLVFLTSNIKGLDVNHVGIAYQQDGKLQMIHCTIYAHKVVITTNGLYQYLMAQSRHSGIMVVSVVAKNIK